MPVTVTCTCGIVHSVPGSRAGSKMACSCGRAITIPPRDRTPAPVTLASSGTDQSAADATILAIKRMVRTRELPPAGVCPCTGKPADDIVVFRLHFDPAAERALAEAAEAKLGGFSLFGWLAGKGSSAATHEPSSAQRHVSVDMPLRVASSAHAEILRSTSQKHFRDMLRTVPIYATLLGEHPTARIEPLPRHSDGQPTQGQRR